MKAGRTDGDFAHSLTDLMSGLAVMFLLIAAIFMVHSARATAAARKAAALQKKVAEERKQDADQLDKLKRKDQASIDKLVDLKTKLEGNARLTDRIDIRYNPNVDPLLLTISFTNEKLQFRSNECEVSSEQREDLRATLAELFPQLCETVTGTSVTQTIALEGHTDRSWPLGSSCGMTISGQCTAATNSIECQRQAFENNVRLSARRAQYVFFQARDVLRDNAKVAACLDDYFVVSGRGPTSPIEPKDPRSAKNRRVEIKVRVTAASAASSEGRP